MPTRASWLPYLLAWPRVTWQRRWTHYLRDLLPRSRNPLKPWVATLVRSIFDQPDALEVQAHLDRVVKALGSKLPEPSVHLGEAREDLLSFSAFPRAIWRQIWSLNPQERLNREIRRRTDVVGIFPERSSIIRLIGAVLMEQTEKWAESRRYMGIEVLETVDKNLEPPLPSQTETSLELPEAAMV